MSVFNRRNATVGWLALLVGKRVLKRKAKAAARAVDAEARRPRHKVAALLLTAGVGAAAFLRRRPDDDSGA